MERELEHSNTLNICAVLHCKTSKFHNSEAIIYPFPLNKPILLEQWLKLIGRFTWKPVPGYGVCSIHFQKTDKINNIKLKLGSLPILSLPRISKISSTVHTKKGKKKSHLVKSENWEPQINVFYKNPELIQTGPDPLLVPEYKTIKQEPDCEDNLLQSIETEPNEFENSQNRTDEDNFAQIQVKEEPRDMIDVSETFFIGSIKSEIKTESVDYPVETHLKQIFIKEEPQSENFIAPQSNQPLNSILIHDETDLNLRKGLNLKSKNKLKKSNKSDNEIKQLRHQIMIETHKLRVLVPVYKKLKRELENEIRIRQEQDPLTRKCLIRIKDYEDEIESYENLMKLYKYRFRIRRRQYILRKIKQKQKQVY